jgi:dynein light chain 1, axonemal
MKLNTSLKQAIEKYATEREIEPSEAKEIKLIFQNPPIERLDIGILSKLTNCEALRLSTNAINAMISFGGMKNLKILSLSRNQIKHIRGLDEVGTTLEQLWLSYNLVEKLDNLSKCEVLRVLYVAHNKIKEWGEIEKLAELSTLRTVVLLGNDIYNGAEGDPRLIVLKKVP